MAEAALDSATDSPSAPPFPLGAALSFGEPADTCADPNEQVPTGWLTAFPSHADAEVWTGLFRSSRSGRDFVLQSAAQVSVSLDTTDAAVPEWAWPGRVSAVQQVLSTRGDRPAHLSVTCNGSQHSERAAESVRALLHPESAVTALTLRDHSEPTQQWPCPAYIQLVPFAYHSMPQLVSLTLHVFIPLPPTSSLPNLRQLTVMLCTDDQTPTHTTTLTSISEFTTQLTSLTFDYGQDSVDWSSMFLQPTHSLQRFSTASDLDDQLLGALVRNVQGLRQLAVGDLGLESDSHSDFVWGVGELDVCDWQDHTWASLACLPRCKDGQQLQISTDGILLWADERGVDTDVCLRLGEYRIKTQSFTIEPSPDLETEDQRAALVLSIYQLGQTLQLAEGCSAVLYMEDWHWTPGMLRAYTQSLGMLAARGLQPSGDLAVHTPLTEGLLAAALEGAAQLRSLTVDSLAVQSYQCSDTAWPWDELTVHTLDVSRLMTLPSPMGGATRRKVKCGHLVLDGDVLEVGLKKLRKRLAWLEWVGGRPRVSLCGRVGLDGSSTRCAELLRALTTILEAVQFSGENTRKPVHISLYHWPLTHSVLRALKSLPQWCKVEGSTLDLSTCTWPLPPVEYQETLPECLPHSFTEIVLGGEGQYAVLLSICAGLNKRCEDQGESAQSVTLVIDGQFFPEVTVGRVKVRAK